MKRLMSSLSLAIAVAVATSPAVAQNLGNIDGLVPDRNLSQASEEDKNAFCGKVREATDELNERLPVQIYTPAKMVAVETTFAEGQCTIDYRHEIDGTVLLEVLQEDAYKQTGQNPALEVIEHYYGATEEGFWDLKTLFREILLSDPQLVRLLHARFIKVEAHYQVNGEQIDDFDLSLARQ